MNTLSHKLVGRPLNDGKRPVYMQKWFTEIAERSEKARKLFLVQDGRPVSSLTLELARNCLGMKQAYNLSWARLCGPSIPEHFSNYKKAQITRELIRQLPTDVSYFLTLANKADYELFVAEGFQSALEENYTISHDRLATLQYSFSNLTKRHIRQAKRHLVVSTTTPEDFIDTYATNLFHRRRRPSASLAIALDILKEGLRRDQARIFTANRRNTRKIDAAIACLWDDENYYYWMTTRRTAMDGETRPLQGAVKLLLLSAIQDAGARGLTFDFDGVGASVGSVKNGISRLYGGMGARPSVRYRVKRETKLEQVIGPLRVPVKLAIKKTLGRFVALKYND
jgi:hypothetical protein